MTRRRRPRDRKWPWPGRRPLVVAAGATGALAALVGVVWILPVLLTRHPAAGMTSAERLSAANDVRTALAALVVAIGAVGSLFFTGRSYTLSREGHITDRFSKAVEQLGSPNPAVRLGGLYALERIGKDSHRDRNTVVYVVGAFVRQADGESSTGADGRLMLGNESQTAINVLLRVAEGWPGSLNLRGARLQGAQLQRRDLSRAWLHDADLTDANLAEACLTDCVLRRASLVRTNLSGANLRGADLRGADWTDANLDGADLEGAMLDPPGPEPG